MFIDELKKRPGQLSTIVIRLDAEQLKHVINIWANKSI